MATVTLTVISNSDGTMTATTASAPAQTLTTPSLTELQNVLKGWVQQAFGGIGLS